MHVRKARPQDVARAVRLARSLELDYSGLEADPLWVAEEGGNVIGLVALKTHPDCLELCALGVEPGFRRKGIGKALVEALLAAAPGDVHLATTIPAIFESCGFRRTSKIPPTFPAKRKSGWCEGCAEVRCTVMVRIKP
jgi:N-acetylglutamate synthase-like GNAT family acetyltransferase